MSKPNKDGWIRHRGGVPKCLNDITFVRLRKGDVWPIERWFDLVKPDSKAFWTQYGLGSILGTTDIMAYKLKEQLEP